MEGITEQLAVTESKYDGAIKYFLASVNIHFLKKKKTFLLHVGSIPHRHTQHGAA